MQSYAFARVGVNRSSGGYYVLFGNPAWESLKAGQDHDVHFQFDDYTPWDVPTTGVVREELSY